MKTAAGCFILMATAIVALAEIHSSTSHHRHHLLPSIGCSTNSDFWTAHPPRPDFLRHRMDSSTLAPGTYLTEPYVCVVGVPGPQHDDRCLIGGGDGDSQMPIMNPGLQFIPLSPNSK
jgi:hypothetical protein